MKASVNQQFGLMQFNDSYKSKAPYFPKNNTYLMNGYTFGIFNDVLHLLEEQLNFTCSLFTRKDTKWGKITRLSNGSIVGTGMLGDLYREKVDISVASLSMTLSRAKYISFLTPITNEVLSIVIPSSSVMEDYDFWLFFGPLHIATWMVILATAILVMILHVIGTRDYRMISIPSTFWSSLMAFLGGSHLSDKSRNFPSKLITICLLLCGYVTWTSHNAFLTAELVSVKKVYPFTDLESISATNWRYIVYIYKYHIAYITIFDGFFQTLYSEKDLNIQ